MEAMPMLNVISPSASLLILE